MHAAASSVGVSAGASFMLAEYSAPPAPALRQFPSYRQQPTLPVSLPLSRFATNDISLSPDPAQLQSNTTQIFPLSPGSRSLTPCYDLAEFYSENSCTVMSQSPVSDAAVGHSEMLLAPSWSTPLGCGPKGCGIACVRRCCRVFGVVISYVPVHAS